MSVDLLRHFLTNKTHTEKAYQEKSYYPGINSEFGAMTLQSLGDIYYENGDAERAVEYLTKAIEPIKHSYGDQSMFLNNAYFTLAQSHKKLLCRPRTQAKVQ